MQRDKSAARLARPVGKARAGADARLLRVDEAIARRAEIVRVAGFDWTLECLDDLDAVTYTLVAQLPGGRDVAHAASEACPHFGVLWPAAVALCEHLAARGTLKGQSVLELGCGLALPSMALAPTMSLRPIVMR